MVFEFLDLKPRNPFFSLALDEALCRYYSTRQDFEGGLRLWANDTAIILGRTCRADLNLPKHCESNLSFSHIQTRRKNGLVVCRRASGGGTVLHGPGSINYSIYLPLGKHSYLFPVQTSYRVLMKFIQKALDQIDIRCETRGQSDLVISDEEGRDRKVSGNAQMRKAGTLLYHGTLILNQKFIEQVAALLPHPPREPEYRDGRKHADFLGTLPDTFDVAAFHNSLAAILRRFLKVKELDPLSAEEKQEIFRLAKKLTCKIYGDSEWILKGVYPPDAEKMLAETSRAKSA